MLIREFFAPPNNCNDNENNKTATATGALTAAALASVTLAAALRPQIDLGGKEILVGRGETQGERAHQVKVWCRFPGAPLAKVNVVAGNDRDRWGGHKSEIQPLAGPCSLQILKGGSFLLLLRDLQSLNDTLS